MATSAVGSITFDVFRTFGTAVTQTKVVKDIAKVVKGLIDAGLFSNPEIKDSSSKVIAAIDVIEFGESLAYIAKWIDPTYTFGDAKDNPKQAALYSKLGQISLFFTRLFGVLKVSNSYSLLTIEQWKKLGDALPVIRDHLGKFPAFDTLGGLFYIPFGGTVLFDNSSSGVKGYREFKNQDAKITKWINKNDSDIHQAVNSVKARRDAKIAQHTAQKEKAFTDITKNLLGGTSTVFKMTAASTAVVAAFAFGGVACVLGTLVILGLAGNTLSLGKNFYEAYQAKYATILSQNEKNARAAAAAA